MKTSAKYFVLAVGP